MRKLPAAIAVSAFLLLGGCANLPATLQSIESQIQQGTAVACHFVPTLETIDAVAAALTGQIPGAGAVLSLAGAALAAVEADICAGVPPVASARFHALPRLGSPYAGRAGISASGVPIHGWQV